MQCKRLVIVVGHIMIRPRTSFFQLTIVLYCFACFQTECLASSSERKPSVGERSSVAALSRSRARKENLIVEIPRSNVSQKSATKNPELDSLADSSLIDSKPIKPPGGIIGWFLAPVTKLQNEVVRLEKRIAILTVSLNELEPGAFDLNKNMSAIHSQTAVLLEQIASAQSDLKKLQVELSLLTEPIMQLKDPVAQLREPVLSLQKPLISTDNHVAALGKRFTDLDSRLDKLGKRFAKLDTRFVELYGRFSELDGRFSQLDGHFTDLDNRFMDLDYRFSELDSRFTELDGRFSILDLRFEALGKQLSSLQKVLENILLSVLVGTVTSIVVGTFLTVILIRKSKFTFALNKEIPSDEADSN